MESDYDSQLFCLQRVTTKTVTMDHLFCLKQDLAVQMIKELLHGSREDIVDTVRR